MDGELSTAKGVPNTYGGSSLSVSDQLCLLLLPSLYRARECGVIKQPEFYFFTATRGFRTKSSSITAAIGRGLCVVAYPPRHPSQWNNHEKQR